MRAVEKYLGDWAEPEVALGRGVEGPYERAVVVPACAEGAELLDGYTAASQTSAGRTLLVLVVNGPEDGTEVVHGENRDLLGAIRERLKRVRELQGPRVAFLGALQLANLDVLVVDRASEGARIPRKEGVGLARKIGTDMALDLVVRGVVRSPYIHSTDADATLPEAHFDLPELEGRESVAAVVFPFWHESGADTAVTRATALYELSLRYHVAGLSWAGSPYAFHTLGSAMAVTAAAYAAVRGYPKREAAEDFYLLNKIAKVGAVIRVPRSPVRLRSRTSERTPFGTGAAVSRALGGEEPAFHAPAAFAALRGLLARLDAFAAHADTDRLFAELAELDPPARAAILSVLEELDARKAFVGAAAEAPSEHARRIRVHGFLDAFRTLKVLHAIRDAGVPDLSPEHALRAAPFSPTRGEGEGPELVAARYAFAHAEARTPMVLGPWR